MLLPIHQFTTENNENWSTTSNTYSRQENKGQLTKGGKGLWRAVYAPGDGQTSLAYSSHSVQ
jgi:hypothetical protein